MNTIAKSFLISKFVIKDRVIMIFQKEKIYRAILKQIKLSYYKNYHSIYFWVLSLAVASTSLLILKQSMSVKLYVGKALIQLQKFDYAVRYFETLKKKINIRDNAKGYQMLHQIDFFLTKIHFIQGQKDVSDPLIRCTLNIWKSVGFYPKYHIGYYAATINRNSIKIEGIILSDESKSLTVNIDDYPIKHINLSKTGKKRTFFFSMKRNTVCLMPKECLLTVMDDKGRNVSASKIGSGVKLFVPHGRGKLLQVLNAGLKINKKGYIMQSKSQTEDIQQRSIELYKKARDHFFKRQKQPLFILYGTLLGVYREGDLIKTDDDFDVGFISKGHTPQDMKRHSIQIIIDLIEAGFTISFNAKGRLFRIYEKSPTVNQIHLDVHPIWFQKDKVWFHPHFTMDGDVGDFVPGKKRKLRDTYVYIPNNSEKFLKRNYGPDWQTPDPTFSYHKSDISPSVLKAFSDAFITPHEFLELQEHIQNMSTDNKFAGQLYDTFFSSADESE